ncbi:MAG: hypothetical protein QM757_43270 [Paludibaculum sp.]
MASKQSMQVADLNAPVVLKMLEWAQATNAELAGAHHSGPRSSGAPGHLIMAAALLDSWGAPGIVSEVEIDAKALKLVSGKNTSVTGLSGSNGLTWSQMDNALPMPVDLNDAATALAVKSADFLEKLDKESLKVSGLKPGHYALRIDGLQVAVFTAEQLAEGLKSRRMAHADDAAGQRCSRPDTEADRHPQHALADHRSASGSHSPGGRKGSHGRSGHP